MSTTHRRSAVTACVLDSTTRTDLTGPRRHIEHDHLKPLAGLSTESWFVVFDLR